jgi:predicted nucleic acid-binding Zn ribbon protein
LSATLTEVNHPKGGRQKAYQIEDAELRRFMATRVPRVVRVKKALAAGPIEGKATLTLDQAASISGLSKTTLRRAITAGKLSARLVVKKGPRPTGRSAFQIDRAELDRFLSEKQRSCLVCGAPITGAVHGNAKLCSEGCREVWDKQKRSTPEYRAQAVAAEAKRRLKPEVQATNKKRTSDPIYRATQNAKKRDEYWADLPKSRAKSRAASRKWYSVQSHRDEHNRKAREKDAARDPVTREQDNAQQRKQQGEARRLKKLAAQSTGGASKEAKRFLRAQLPRGGSQLVTTITEAAVAAHISLRTLRRARDDMGIVVEKLPQYQGAWTWRRPRD